MTDHYYTPEPGVAHDRQSFEVRLRGRMYRFVTDAGVFSRGGLDFGSRVLIEALQLSANDNVLDVGCGYGPIGLAAASLVPQGQVTLIDVNARAVALARENAKVNQVHNVEVFQSDLYEQVKGREYDVILTNPPIRAGKATVHAIFEQGFELLRTGGAMWVVIQKKQGAPSAKEKLQQLYGEVHEVTKEKGYRIFQAIKH